MAEEKKNELDPQVLAVKKYLEAQCEKDDALRSFYKPERIGDCFSYIKGEARKHAVGGCAMVEDAVVYKWARDYYLEEISKEDERKAKADENDKKVREKIALKNEDDERKEDEPEETEVSTEVKAVVVEKQDDAKPVRQLTLFDM